jgi:hypothetical protein
MDLIKYILGEFSVISGAPIAFILSIIAVSLLIFYLMRWGYGRENSYLRTQVDDYKEKLKGASPQEARDRIDELEKAAKITIGQKWPPLSSAESKQISDAVRPYDKANYVFIGYANVLGLDLANSLGDCFKTAGWKVDMNAGAPADIGIAIGHGDNAQDIKKIIEDRSSLRLRIFRPGQQQTFGQITIYIGINAAA